MRAIPTTIMTRIVIAMLLLLGAAYYANGMVNAVRPGIRNDLELRWKERSLIAQGVNPYDVSASFEAMERSPGESARLTSKGLNNPPPNTPSGYPAWGFAQALVLIPSSSFAVVQWWYVLLSTAALAGVMWFAYSVGARHSRSGGWLIAASVFAMAGNASTFRLGQYGLILNAAILVSYLAQVRNNNVLTGLGLFLAAIKPSYSAWQFLPYIVRWKWAAIAIVAVLCVAGSLVSLYLTGVSPVEMTRQMLVQSRYVVKGDSSLANLFASESAHKLSLAILGPASLVVMALLSWKYRKNTMMVSIALAAIIGRISTYHRQYDNVMLVFPLILIALILVARPSRKSLLSFAVVGLTLWLPFRLTFYTPVTIAVLSAIWIYAGWFILRNVAVLDAFFETATGQVRGPDSGANQTLAATA